MAFLKRFWPILPIVAIAVAIFASGLNRNLSWAALAQNHDALASAVAAHPLVAPAIFAAVYLVVVAASVPGAVWLTIASGLLFGVWFGTALSVVAAGSGACLLFLAARSSLGAALRERALPLMERMRPGLERDGFFYLLSVRLLPVVPFWITNLAPALVGMRLLPYAAATFLGIIPATAIFASVGAGLGDVLAAGRTPDLGVLLSRGILLPLCAMFALSLLPVVWRRVRGSG